MMRGFLRSLLVLCVLGGIAFAEDPMPSEQAADPKPSGFEVVKKDTQPVITPTAKPAKHKKRHVKARHKPRKHKKAHRKAKHA
jgi:hypothetical protein